MCLLRTFLVHAASPASRATLPHNNISRGPWQPKQFPESRNSGISYVFHHFRCLAEDVRPLRLGSKNSHAEGRHDGFALDRLRRRLTSAPDASIAVRERRFSIAVACRFWETDPHQLTQKRYNVACIISPGDGSHLNPRESPIAANRIEQINDLWAPMVGFIAIFYMVLPIWTSSWTSVLDGVEGLFFDKNILQHQQVHRISADDRQQQSEFYFQTMQLLRLSKTWIDDTHRDFKQTRISIMGSTPDKSSLPGSRVMGFNWDYVEQELERQVETLQARIDRVMKEIKGMRKDVFYPLKRPRPSLVCMS